MPWNELRSLLRRAEEIRTIANPVERRKLYARWKPLAQAVWARVPDAPELYWRVDMLGHDVLVISGVMSRQPPPRTPAPKRGQGSRHAPRAAAGAAHGTPGKVISQRPRRKPRTRAAHGRGQQADDEVFVVYGRDRNACKAMFEFLRALGLHPLEWDEVLAKETDDLGAPYVGRALDRAFSSVSAVVVLLTPDDEARLRPEYLRKDDPLDEREPTPQPRPNVLFEAGMAFGRHPEKTVLVRIGGCLRRLSDLEGRHVISMDGSEAARRALLDRLARIGCPVQVESGLWKTAGSFETP